MADLGRPSRPKQVLELPKGLATYRNVPASSAASRECSRDCDNFPSAEDHPQASLGGFSHSPKEKSVKSLKIMGVCRTTAHQTVLLIGLSSAAFRTNSTMLLRTVFMVSEGKTNVDPSGHELFLHLFAPAVGPLLTPLVPLMPVDSSALAWLTNRGTASGVAGPCHKSRCWPILP